MKHTFTGREIGHAWWHETHDTYGKAGNVSFYDGLLLSYSTGIARKCKTPDGRVYAIVNRRLFSNSTSAHQSYARRAIPIDTPVFDVSEGMGARLVFSPLGLLDEAKKDHDDAIKSLYEMRGNNRLEKRRLRTALRANTHKERAKKICEFFDLETPAWVSMDENESMDAAIKFAAEEKRRFAEIQKRREEEARRDIEDWINGGPFKTSFNSLAPRLRVNPQNILSIETSLGAEIPYDDGRRAFMFCIRMRDKGWRTNGETFSIGSYQLNSVNENGIVAGCHRITWSEIERFATQQGWMAAQSTENP